MSIVKITDLPDVIHNNGDGSELGQIVQGDESKKAVLLFSDSSNKEFVVPYDYSIKAATVNIRLHKRISRSMEHTSSSSRQTFQLKCAAAIGARCAIPNKENLCN